MFAPQILGLLKWWGGQIISTTLLIAPLDFQTFLRPFRSTVALPKLASLSIQVNCCIISQRVKAERSCRRRRRTQLGEIFFEGKSRYKIILKEHSYCNHDSTRPAQDRKRLAQDRHIISKQQETDVISDPLSNYCFLKGLS